MHDFLNAPGGNAPVAIYEDGGGLVTQYQRAALQYSLERRRVEIRGSCRSACILALSVPTTCVAPGAIVKAHQAYEESTKRARPDVTREMLDSLPPKVRDYLYPRVQVHYTAQTTLFYSDLRDLGVPSCSPIRARVERPVPPQPGFVRQIFKLFGSRM